MQTKLGFITRDAISKAYVQAFSHSSFSHACVDDLSKLIDVVNTDFVFVVSTSQDDVVDALTELSTCAYAGVVIIVSTITFETLARIEDTELSSLRVVINPTFVRDNNAVRDLSDSTQIVLGSTDAEAIELVHGIYKRSYIRKHWVIKMTSKEATAYKLMIDTYLATKVSLFNEFREILTNVSPRSWNEFVFYMQQDPRVGNTHVLSPGPDGQHGFGGEHFIASIESLSQFAIKQNSKSNTIAGALKTNQMLRYPSE